MTLMPGSVVGDDFVVVRPLSEGGMGAVWVAQQRSTGRLRALKVMRPELVASAELRARFEREARIASQIDSSHVVDVVAAGLLPVPWLAMELLDGQDLADYLARQGCVSSDEVLTIFRQLCHALGAAHARNIVHRDLKPENVFLARSTIVGVPFMVKVLDFGIAKFADEAATRGNRNTTSIGSRPWMAPEQLHVGAAITPATDVWALGLIAFALLFGRNYWRAMYDPNANEMMLVMELSASPLVAASVRARENGSPVILPTAFDAWFSRCVDRDPARRHPSAQATLAGLETALATNRATVPRTPTIPMAPTPPPQPPRPPLDRARAAKDWDSLYADYARIERGRGAALMPFDVFKTALTRLAKDVMAKNGCTKVEFVVREHEGRAHLQADPVFDL